MNISLSDQMKEWVDGQINSGAYHNVSEYVRDLIRKDQKAIIGDRAFLAAIEMGRESGIDNRNFDQIIADIKIKAKQDNAA